MRLRVDCLRVTIAAVLAVVGDKGHAQGDPAPVHSSCETSDTTALEALEGGQEHAVGRISAECRVDGGPLDGATLKILKVYAVKDGRGTLITGLSEYRSGETTVRAEATEGRIVREDSGGWSANWKEVYKATSGEAGHLAGRTEQWSVRGTGPGHFEMDSQGAGNPPGTGGERRLRR